MNLTSVLGYEGNLPSGAFSKLGLVVGGGKAEQVELVLLALFSLFSCSKNKRIIHTYSGNL